jgi:hypothetical protein
VISVKRETLLPIAAGLLVLAVGLAIVDTLPVGIVHDDGMYVILAKALATGQGYRWVHVPGAPAATHFPPGYPALLALLWKVSPSFPDNVVLFKVANALLLAIAATALAVFGQRRLELGPRVSSVIGAATCIGIPTLVLSTMVMSEPLFLALVIPILLLAERVAESDRRLPVLIGLGVAAAAATLVRTHGIALVAALAVVLLMRRRVRDAVVCTLSAVSCLLPWQLWSASHQGTVPAPMRGNYESYASWFAAGLRIEGLGLIARTVARTTGELSSMLEVIIAPLVPFGLKRVALALFLVLAVVGLRRLWRLAPVTALFTVLYAAVVVMWPFTPARFIWGIWPLVLVLPILGVAELWHWRPTTPAAQGARFALATSALLLTVGYGVYNVRGYRGHWWSSIARQGTAQLAPLIAWASAHTRADEVISSSAEAAVYLYTGRPSLPATSFTVRDYFRPPSVDEARTALRGIMAAYHVDAVAVVAADSLRVAAESMASGRPPELVLRDTFPNGLVFTPVR